jgi:hypothetical protein
MPAGYRFSRLGGRPADLAGQQGEPLGQRLRCDDDVVLAEIEQDPVGGFLALCPFTPSA